MLRTLLAALTATVLLNCPATAADLGGDADAQVAADAALRQRLQQRIDELAADPEAYQKAMVEGGYRTVLCKVCHGEDGNAVRDGTPNLAGQDPVYIVDQFSRYGDGRRQDFWMGSLVKNFTEEDKVNLAIFYSEQAMQPAGGGDITLIARGKTLYTEHCVECHGVDGRSEQGYARLAGQRPEYTAKMLREFRSATGKRFSPIMYPRAYMLKTEQDIAAVATYLAHLE
jgi:cytochrome c553